MIGIYAKVKSNLKKLSRYDKSEVNMYWDVIEVKVVENLMLNVRFEDGTFGKVRFKQEHLTGVFEPLKNPQFFAKVFIDSGAVAWPNDIDLAPDAMYKEIKKHGEWVLQ
jgi:hypothetical protein